MKPENIMTENYIIKKMVLKKEGVYISLQSKEDNKEKKAFSKNKDVANKLNKEDKINVIAQKIKGDQLHILRIKKSGENETINF